VVANVKYDVSGVHSFFPATPLQYFVWSHSTTTTTPHATPIKITKMVLAKSKKSVGLGNSLMNDRFGKGKGADMRRGAFEQGIKRTGQNGEEVC
jgi:hypothetical protein